MILPRVPTTCLVDLGAGRCLASLSSLLATWQPVTISCVKSKSYHCLPFISQLLSMVPRLSSLYKKLCIVKDFLNKHVGPPLSYNTNTVLRQHTHIHKKEESESHKKNICNRVRANLQCSYHKHLTELQGGLEKFRCFSAKPNILGITFRFFCNTFSFQKPIPRNN